MRAVRGGYRRAGTRAQLVVFFFGSTVIDLFAL